MAEKKASKKKIEVICIRSFRDKHTGELHKKGEVFKVTEARLAEILAVGELVAKHDRAEK